MTYLPAGAESCVHVGHFALDELKVADWLVELFAVVCVGNGDIARRLHQTNRSAGQDQPLQIQARHENVGALANTAENVRFVHGRILEHQLAGRANVFICC